MNNTKARIIEYQGTHIFMDYSQNAINTVYALADYFEVTEEYMSKAIKFYQDKYGYIY